MSSHVCHSFRRRLSLCIPIFLATISSFLPSGSLQAAPVVSRDINTYVLFGYDELVGKVAPWPRIVVTSSVATSV